MSVMLITALRAAETLAAFHLQRAGKAAGEELADHLDRAQRCTDDVERITSEILAGGLSVENQAAAMRRRDLEAAYKIIDRHPIMHGVGIPSDDVPPAKSAMARDIADALAAERGGLTGT
jgi:hypothetical protein